MDEQIKLEDVSRLKLDVGCIIFENADRYIRSEVVAETFIEWLESNISSDIKLLFHFTNPNLEHVSKIKEVTKSYLISFNKSIILNNKPLNNLSQYFKIHLNDMEIVKRYNLDDDTDYINTFNRNSRKIWMDSQILFKGNLDYYYAQAKEISEILRKLFD